MRNTLSNRQVWQSVYKKTLGIERGNVETVSRTTHKIALIAHDMLTLQTDVPNRSTSRR
jgi:hypothetical protein